MLLHLFFFHLPLVALAFSLDLVAVECPETAFDLALYKKS